MRGRDIRLGGGFADVGADHAGSTYRTSIEVGRGVGAERVLIGHTLPAGAQVARVVLDGRVVPHYRARRTNRGLEVAVPTTAGRHTLTVTT